MTADLRGTLTTVSPAPPTTGSTDPCVTCVPVETTNWDFKITPVGRVLCHPPPKSDHVPSWVRKGRRK